MARKPLKLTKNALMLLGIIALLLITFLVLKFGGTKSEQPEKKVTETLSGLVVENQVLKVQLLDFVVIRILMISIKKFQWILKQMKKY